MIDWTSLPAYFEGTASAEERRALEEWVGRDPEHAQMLEGARRIWNAPTKAGGSAESFDLSPMRQRVMARTIERRDASPNASPSRSYRFSRRDYARRFQRGVTIAAIGGAMALLVASLLHFETTLPPALSHVTYITRQGERRAVTLADGSRITLAPLTTVAVTANDQGTDVTVQGEALFTVTHRGTSPFVAHIGRTSARVLGTTFTVRHYATDRRGRIIVVDGRVAVGDAVLPAQTVGIVDDSGAVSITHDASVREYIEWTHGLLVFRDTPVRDIIGDVGRSYDVEIRLADSTFASRKLTWRVSVEDRSLQEVLNGLGMLLDAHYTRAGRVVTLLPGRAASRWPSEGSLLTTEPHYGK